MPENETEQIKTVVEQLIKDLNLEAEVAVLASDDESVKIQLDSTQAALLIGFHGENLRCLQSILSFLIHQKVGRWLKLEINVGDYLQKREEQLRKLALNLAMKAKFSGETQIVPNLSSSERRMIHMILTDHPDVSTQSEGEGRQRCLTIKPKNK